MPPQSQERTNHVRWSRALLLFLVWQLIGALVLLCLLLIGLILNVCYGHLYCPPPYSLDISYFYYFYIPIILDIILLVIICAQLVHFARKQLSINELFYCELAKIVWVVPPYAYVTLLFWTWERRDHSGFPRPSPFDYLMGVIEAVVLAPVPYIAALAIAIVAKNRVSREVSEEETPLLVSEEEEPLLASEDDAPVPTGDTNGGIAST